MKTTEQKNRMIAEFMGMQLTNIGWFDNEEVLKLSHTMDNTFDELLFHTSWDWLMPVVEKIEGLGFTIEKNFQPVDNDWQCLVVKGNDILFQEFNEQSIQAMHYVVSEFIEWYNEQKF